MKKSEAPILVAQDFQTSTEAIWLALTAINEMKQWYFDNIPDFQPKIGFKTQFPIHNEGRTFTHLWEVTDVIPYQSITYRWHYKEYSGDSRITFALTEIGKQIRLNLKLEILEDFPDNIPEFKRESGLAGWNYFIKERLKEYLK